jgi:hypothetical protein
MAGEWRPYWLSGQPLCRTSTGAALRGDREKIKWQRKGRKKRGEENGKKENSGN